MYLFFHKSYFDISRLFLNPIAIQSTTNTRIAFGGISGSAPWPLNPFNPWPILAGTKKLKLILYATSALPQKLEFLAEYFLITLKLFTC